MNATRNRAGSIEERNRQDQTRATLDRLSPPPPSSRDPQVCQTVNPAGSTYPASANRYFWVQPLEESGPEVEGGAVSYTNRSSPFLAAHSGATLPTVGTKVLVFWCARVGFVFEN